MTAARSRSHHSTPYPQIITTLRQQGYEFVTVPELLELHHQQMQATKG
ncbi:MAG: hypothetical protein HC838_06940 [Spirulinaceae cyanobacterium RM2_2_10]|nr:hypothetical protein [Spirulinaceae cyanobacterium RM2_2_10]